MNEWKAFQEAQNVSIPLTDAELEEIEAELQKESEQDLPYEELPEVGVEGCKGLLSL